jgi:hypothetical protein
MVDIPAAGQPCGLLVAGGVGLQFYE